MRYENMDVIHVEAPGQLSMLSILRVVLSIGTLVCFYAHLCRATEARRTQLPSIHIHKVVYLVYVGIWVKRLSQLSEVIRLISTLISSDLGTVWGIQRPEQAVGTIMIKTSLNDLH